MTTFDQAKEKLHSEITSLVSKEMEPLTPGGPSLWCTFSYLSFTFIDSCRRATRLYAIRSTIAGTLLYELCFLSFPLSYNTTNGRGSDINRIRNEVPGIVPRIMVTQISYDVSAQYIPIMNCIFSAQKQVLLLLCLSPPLPSFFYFLLSSTHSNDYVGDTSGCLCAICTRFYLPTTGMPSDRRNLPSAIKTAGPSSVFIGWFDSASSLSQYLTHFKSLCDSPVGIYFGLLFSQVLAAPEAEGCRLQSLLLLS